MGNFARISIKSADFDIIGHFGTTEKCRYLNRNKNFMKFLIATSDGDVH
jgi:hypothetical protein